ncbi:MAG: CYTH domain-containing protein [Rhodospirillaceae bacterium]
MEHISFAVSLSGDEFLSMHLEIERRFLATPAALSWCRAGTDIEQGYLRADGRITVRVRIADETGILTIKGKRCGCSRLEHETPIALDRARAMLAGMPPQMRLRKTRYPIVFGGLTWEIDVFSDLNAGLILAEVEINHPDQPVVLPDWVTAEVTGDKRYSNSQLAKSPYGLWTMAA